MHISKYVGKMPRIIIFKLIKNVSQLYTLHSMEKKSMIQSHTEKTTHWGQIEKIYPRLRDAQYVNGFSTSLNSMHCFVDVGSYENAKGFCCVT